MIRHFHFLLFFLAVALFSCKKEQEPEPVLEYFMHATINGMEWQASLAAAQIDYNHYTTAFNSSLFTGGKGPLADGIEYSLDFALYNDIAKGKYYFNNDGTYEVQSNGGIFGSIRIEKPTILPSHSRDHFYAYTTFGFIEITHLTRYEMGGNFEFTAIPCVCSGYADSESYKVEKGTFLVPITGVSGAKWGGPK